MRLVSSICGLGLLGFVITNCSDDNSGGTPGSAGTAGAAESAGGAGAGGEVGAAGAPAPHPVGGEAGAAPKSSCGGLVGGSECDPVTGAPCKLGAGETCDYSNARGSFACFPGPNPAGFCEFCDGDTVTCGAGLTCDTNNLACVRYCCADSDCGSGTCTLNNFDVAEVATVGVCFDELDATCAATGAAGTGGEGGGSSGGGGQGGTG
jgi:hypothetical protein